MDILAQLKAERDKAAQQVNALDTAIKALNGLHNAAAKRGLKPLQPRLLVGAHHCDVHHHFLRGA